MGKARRLGRDPLRWERRFRKQHGDLLAGIDEVGRGPLAGPVVAAAVVMPPGRSVRGVDDSKLLPRAVRFELAATIRSRALAVGVGAASAREVDRLNIRVASGVAMRRALAALQIAPDHLLVDGLPVNELGSEHSAVIDGDAKVHCIACASIIAKTVRDTLMERLARRYPAYGWEHNAGYGTEEHRAAIDRHGMTPHHRRTFGSVQLRLTLQP